MAFKAEQRGGAVFKPDVKMKQYDFNNESVHCV